MPTLYLHVPTELPREFVLALNDMAQKLSAAMDTSKSMTARRRLEAEARAAYQPIAKYLHGRHGELAAKHKPCVCPVCDEGFHCFNRLARHVSAMHMKGEDEYDAPHRCFCGKVFPRRGEDEDKGVHARNRMARHLMGVKDLREHAKEMDVSLVGFIGESHERSNEPD